MKKYIKIFLSLSFFALGGCVILFTTDHNDAKKVDVKVNGVGTISIDNVTPTITPTPSPTSTLIQE